MRHVAYDVSQVVTWACWGSVAVAWVAGALLARSPGPARSGRDPSSLAAAAAAAVVLATPESVWRSLVVDSPWVRLAGAVVLVIATVATLWARWALGAMWSMAPRVQQAHQLRTTGPYAITRHPIYTGLLGMLAGTALTQGLGRWAAVFVAVAIILILKLHAEERLLAAEFPEQYERYRREVPQLIPRLGGRA
jgi:protein-S-isoprenylcysteine O-methyltransferase Ste14